MEVLRHAAMCLAFCVLTHVGLEAASADGSNTPRTGSAYLYGEGHNGGTMHYDYYPRVGVRIPPGTGSSAVVRGCRSEDSCAIDFRRNRRGRGVWTLTRVIP